MGQIHSILAVVTLNLFSLNLAQADEVYDALLKSPKTDTETVRELKAKIETPKRIQQMNELTKKNAYRLPYVKSTPKTQAEWDAQKKKEENEPDDEFDKPEGEVATKEDAAPQLAPTTPTGYKKAAREQDAPSAAIKVTHDDTPDEIVFPGDDEEEKPAPKPTPAPLKKKK